MAYMNQEKKKKITARLKAIMPKDWKYSLSVNNHSTIVLTIWSAKVNLLESNNDSQQINHYHIDRIFTGELLATFKKIIAALNTDNYDHSDITTDYINVGHYISINLGRWNKPFIYDKPLELA